MRKTFEKQKFCAQDDSFTTDNLRKWKQIEIDKIEFDRKGIGDENI